MADTFKYDAFLSHNSNDKPQVHRLAERDLTTTSNSAWPAVKCP